jgi:CheY-like chemotaxis protein
MITSKKFAIFVVEDNPADVYLIRQALRKAGVNFELSVIDDGAEGMSFVRNFKKSPENRRPDLAILDLNLPSNGGIEILAAIRRNHDLADVPVVIVTSSCAPFESAQAEALRISRFITKPPDLADFLQIGNVVKEVLAGSEK